MQESKKSDLLPDADRKPGVMEPEVVDPYLGTGSLVDQIVAQVDKMVAEFGDPELASRFESRQFVNQWLECYVPALGDKPSRLLGTKDGCAQVHLVLACSWSGAYA